MSVYIRVWSRRASRFVAYRRFPLSFSSPESADGRATENNGMVQETSLGSAQWQGQFYQSTKYSAVRALLRAESRLDDPPPTKPPPASHGMLSSADLQQEAGKILDSIDRPKLLLMTASCSNRSLAPGGRAEKRLAGRHARVATR